MDLTTARTALREGCAAVRDDNGPGLSHPPF